MLWVARIKEWRASGQSVQEYAEGKGFEGSTLRWRAGQLRRNQLRAREGAPGGAPSVTLRQLVRTPTAQTTTRQAGGNETTRVVVQVGRAAFAVTPGFDAELVRSLVRCLSEDAS